MSRARTLIAFLAGVLLLLPAPPALAHARLVSSAPVDGATLAAAPGEVVLEFNEHVEADFNHVQVLDPLGERVDAGAPVTDGGTVRAELLPPTAAGTYEVAYRVLSADGHPVEGTLAFTLTDEAVAGEPSPEPSPDASPEPETEASPEAGPTPAPDPTPEASPSPQAAAATQETGGLLPWLLVAAIAVLAVAGVALLRGRREA